jgi:hypothetical protein
MNVFRFWHCSISKCVVYVFHSYIKSHQRLKWNSAQTWYNQRKYGFQCLFVHPKTGDLLLVIYIKSAWNLPILRVVLFKEDPYDLRTGFLLISPLFIAGRIIIIQKASVMPSSSLRTILLWREIDVFLK